MLLFFSVARSQEHGSWERATEGAQINTDKPSKPLTKAAASANFGMNMPMMSSAFDTAMWLTTA
ncbi:MAG TPA: hypothetical protein PLG77_05480 [Burkholderiaceae bacterium]|nr:hypothetical protein [Burkholderiaceae bacterium]HRP27864.1 hypothetical protein [Burkholderiaceae bacterium]